MSSPRVWLLTGASTGFGRLTTELVLQKGEIAVATARKPETLQDLAAKYGADKLLVLPCDVTKKEDVTAVFKAAVEKFGRVDVVYNNAGVGVFGEVELQEQEEAARWLFEVNFWGAGRVAAEAVRVFRDLNPPEKKGGLLLNVSSGLGQFGWAGLGYYAASKHALEGLTESLVMELDPKWNIKVSLLELAAFDTRMGRLSGGTSFPILPAYNTPDSLVYQAHQLINQGTPSKGDTAKAVKKIYDLTKLNLDEIPLYFPLGKMTIEGIQGKIKSVGDVVAKFESWSEGLELEA
ncbi:hypothetical protein ONZ45_g10064 [Pleurotus djamor]|nr:hypothetical protein ONZ45_g10064 [Pleurotus djamor]